MGAISVYILPIFLLSVFVCLHNYATGMIVLFMF